MSFLLSIYHWLWAWMGSIIFGHPSRKLVVIGVTGTKGKSTTAELIAAALRAGGRKTAFLSSVWRGVGDRRERNMSGNSMPGRGAIQAFLREALRAGCTHAVIEVTSQGVVQHRHQFIDWDAAVFLNLAPEHIESHGSFENYRAAKVAFFSSLKNSSKEPRFFFVNGNDANRDWFMKAAERVPGSRVTTFDKFQSLQNPWFASDFNKENAAAAAAVAETFGVSAEKIMEALEKFSGVAGRLDFVQKEPFAVIVDYAHTPDSLEAIYRAVRPEEIFGKMGKLICVLGSAGGGRDKWKRPAMGRVAAEYCDAVILTDEDPYDENPENILNEIESGFSRVRSSKLRVKSCYKILDRREALKKAVELAKNGDSVVATGKGSETSIHVAHGKKIPWNERGAFEEILGRIRE